MKSSRFTFDTTWKAVREWTWRPFQPEDDGGPYAIVEVTDHGNGKFTLECEQYYYRDGECKLTITQPLERALDTFGALLLEDDRQEKKR